MVNMTGFDNIDFRSDNTEAIFIDSDKGKFVIEAYINDFYNRYSYTVYRVNTFPKIPRGMKVMSDSKVMRMIRGCVYNYFSVLKGDDYVDIVDFPGIIDVIKGERYNDRTTSIMDDLRSVSGVIIS